MRDPLTVWREYQRCTYWRANIVFAVVAAVVSTAGMRYSAGLWLLIVPMDTFAAAALKGVVTMSEWHFGLTASIAAVGGATSFLHEARADPTNLRIINAIGHMFSAQFAGLLVYFLALEWNWSVPYALAACGLAGWSGNKTIMALNDKMLGRIGINMERRT